MAHHLDNLQQSMEFYMHGANAINDNFDTENGNSYDYQNPAIIVSRPINNLYHKLMNKSSTSTLPATYS